MCSLYQTLREPVSGRKKNIKIITFSSKENNLLLHCAE